VAAAAAAAVEARAARPDNRGVASSQPRRRVATVLFVDIVGSTRLASDLGDDGWRQVLARFRRVVRAELKRWRGREQDTAGDGFYATFAEPAQALRAAASIVATVQELGLDIRVGLHTGECEQIDGKLTGIAVHIGARVMAVAKAAEVLATRTTRDLVVGSDAVFEEAGTHELKGVEGTWLLYRLVSVSERLPGPLDPEVAAERLAHVVGGHRHRRRWPMVAAAAVSAAAVAAGLALGAFGSGGGKGTASLLRIDPASGKVVATVRDGKIGCGCGANLWAVDGTLWERGGDNGQTFAVREFGSGSLKHTFHVPPDMAAFAIGDGALWLARNTYVYGSGKNAGTPYSVVDRIDELSGRRTARIRLPGSFGEGALAVGGGAVWALEGDATLVRINPQSNRVTGKFATGAVETSILIPAEGYLWICECVTHDVLRVDPRTRATKTFHFAQQPWHLVSIEQGKHQTLWLLDGRDATLTRLNPKTGRTGAPLGLAGNPTEAVIAHGSIWVAAGKIVDRVVLSSGVRTAIQLPEGTHATGIAVDPVSNAVWVDNSRKTEGGPPHPSAAALSQGAKLFSRLLTKSFLLSLILPPGLRIPYLSTAAGGDVILTPGQGGT
jgi:class 3 adenylate cyclase/DNA-binding beta-propeller fold protein YncE